MGYIHPEGRHIEDTLPDGDHIQGWSDHPTVPGCAPDGEELLYKEPHPDLPLPGSAYTGSAGAGHTCADPSSTDGGGVGPGGIRRSPSIVSPLHCTYLLTDVPTGYGGCQGPELFLLDWCLAR